MDKIVKVQVWDTAGQERYRSITNAYYRGAEGILIVFDLTKKESFENIENWINEVTVYTGKDVVMICLGNKNDLKKGIDKKDVYEFQKKTGLEIINVSAKTGDGVEEAFKHIIELLIKKNMVKNDETTNNGINLAENKNNTTDKNERISNKKPNRIKKSEIIKETAERRTKASETTGKRSETFSERRSKGSQT